MATPLGKVKQEGLVFLRDGFAYIVVAVPQGAKQSLVVKVNDVWLARRDADEYKFRTSFWSDDLRVSVLSEDARQDLRARYAATCEEIKKHFGIERCLFLVLAEDFAADSQPETWGEM